MHSSNRILQLIPLVSCCWGATLRDKAWHLLGHSATPSQSCLSWGRASWVGVAPVPPVGLQSATVGPKSCSWTCWGNWGWERCPRFEASLTTLRTNSQSGQALWCGTADLRTAHCDLERHLINMWWENNGISAHEIFMQPISSTTKQNIGNMHEKEKNGRFR